MLLLLNPWLVLIMNTSWCQLFYRKSPHSWSTVGFWHLNTEHPRRKQIKRITTANILCIPITAICSRDGAFLGDCGIRNMYKMCLGREWRKSKLLLEVRLEIWVRECTSTSYDDITICSTPEHYGNANFTVLLAFGIVYVFPGTNEEQVLCKMVQSHSTSSEMEKY